MIDSYIIHFFFGERIDDPLFDCSSRVLLGLQLHRGKLMSLSRLNLSRVTLLRALHNRSRRTRRNLVIGS